MCCVTHGIGLWLIQRRLSSDRCGCELIYWHSLEQASGFLDSRALQAMHETLPRPVVLILIVRMFWYRSTAHQAARPVTMRTKIVLIIANNDTIYRYQERMDAFVSRRVLTFVLMNFGLVFVFACLYSVAEHVEGAPIRRTFGDNLRFSLVTQTTVGYDHGMPKMGKWYKIVNTVQLCSIFFASAVMLFH